MGAGEGANFGPAPGLDRPEGNALMQMHSRERDLTARHGLCYAWRVDA